MGATAETTKNEMGWQFADFVWLSDLVGLILSVPDNKF
jgi:hypothetical protein